MTISFPEERIDEYFNCIIQIDGHTLTVQQQTNTKERYIIPVFIVNLKKLDKQLSCE